METLVGAIRLRRPSLYYESGQRGSAPLETALALTGRRKPPDVQKAAVKVTKELPYETAGELFEGLTGLPLSAHADHEVTPEVVQGLSWHPVQTDEDLAAARRQVMTIGAGTRTPANPCNGGESQDCRGGCMSPWFL